MTLFLLKFLFSQCLFTLLSVYLSQYYATFQLELSFGIKLLELLPIVYCLLLKAPRALNYFNLENGIEMMPKRRVNLTILLYVCSCVSKALLVKIQKKL